MTPLEDALAIGETMMLLGGVDKEGQERAAKADLGKAALWYATEVGWHVFPLRGGDKKPLIGRAHTDPLEQRDCHARCGLDGHGLYDATRDPQKIAQWWERNPTAGIGTPTGDTVRGNGDPIGCGFDVIDIDPPDGLTNYLKVRHSQCAPGCSQERFCPAMGPLPALQGVAHTPRGGLHLYVPPSGRGNVNNDELHIDVRATGGYVALPPTRRVGAPAYTWLRRPQ